MKWSFFAQQSYIYLMSSQLPFGALIQADNPRELLFLPTPRATIVNVDSQAILLGPHGRLFHFSGIKLVVSLRPEVIKLLFGTVAGTINGSFNKDDFPLLEVFDSVCEVEEMVRLLWDARESLEAIWDEELFVDWWEGGKTPIPVDRRLQRICQRYGGQNPQAIGRQHRLGQGLKQFLEGVPDYGSEFSDQSHFIRSVRENTGYTPTQIKKMSDSFYLAER